ncbi:MAG: hypothetical protein ABJE10_09845 [bacterium]
MTRSNITAPRAVQHDVAPAKAPTKGVIAAEAPLPATAPLPPVPRDGGQVVVDKQGDRTVFTTTAVPPGVKPMIQRAEQTAIGFMAIVLAIVILGPFARMIARRMEKRSEINAMNSNTEILQQQLHQLQQSVDAMSVEVERISESQRFQSKLLYEKKSG